MRKQPFGVIVLILFLSSLVFISAKTANASSANPIFSDDFIGGTLDAQKWVIVDNLNSTEFPAFGGSVTCANSSVYMSSDGSSFPCAYTAQNPFPTSGDFALEFDMTYTKLEISGSGLWISSGAFRPVTDMPYGEILQVWGDAYGPWGTGLKVFLLGNQVYASPTNWNAPPDPWTTGVSDVDPLLIRLSYCKGTYSVEVNGTEVGKAQSELRPGFIGFGHPPCNWVPKPNPGGWTSFKIDQIKVLPSSSISLITSASTLNIGYVVSLNGTLNDEQSSPIKGVDVVLSYQVPGSSSWNIIGSSRSEDDGRYSAMWLPTGTGTFSVKASWAGDDSYAGTHDSVNISVEKSNETIFLAQSNSTLTSLFFNSTSSDISFTVSGPSGTNGYVRFLISDSMLPDPRDAVLYIDGEQANFTTQTIGNMHYLYFTYSHSTHAVTIKVPTSPIPELPVWMLPPLFIIFAALVIFAVRKSRNAS